MRQLGGTLTDLLGQPLLDRDPAGPRVTHYDESASSRIELSTLTLWNWAAKTANLVRDEFGISAGGRVAVLLPAHWQSAAVLLGAWWAGVEVVLDADPDAELAFVTADRLDEVQDIGEVAAVSLHPLGLGLTGLPVGITDYASAVRVHGDQFMPSGAGLALAGRSVAEVLDAARASAAAHGIPAQARVLSTRSWDTEDDLISGFISVLAVGGSLVQVTGASPERLEHIAQSEKVTHRLA